MAHQHKNTFSPEGKLRLSLFLSISILVGEVIGGVLSNSLALLSDAGHVFADVIALALSWYGVRQAGRPSNSRMTFGYHRVGVIVAVVNAITIFLIAAVILYEAYRRFSAPPEVDSAIMTLVALIGLGVNLFVALLLKMDQKHNINIRSAFWHAFGDALASIAVIAAGIIIFLTGQYWVDPLVSVVISFIILFAAWSILKEGLRVLLEGTPPDIDIGEMVRILKLTPGVVDVHDIHVWSITPEIRTMAGHILIDDIHVSEAGVIREEIEHTLKERFRIEHSTLQMECYACDTEELFCNLNDSCRKDKEHGPEHKH
jgi:cobalt-zinc-cadmium efflux system protein